MLNTTSIYLTIISLLLGGCNKSIKLIDNPDKEMTWHEHFEHSMPLLGHRNWIVVTDMAYPLQTKEGITTLFAEEPYIEVLSFVNNILNKSSHIVANIHLDKEFLYLDENLCPGIDNFREMQKNTLSNSNVTYLPHEELINTIDLASDKYQVIIIKTNLLMPYTSTFFELDCKYWEEKRQKGLEEIIDK